MTEILAENRFELTKKLLFEAVKLSYFEKNSNFLRALFIALGALWALLLGLGLSGGESPVPALFELLALLAMALWALYFVPRGRAGRLWKRILEPERVTSFYGDFLELRAEDKTRLVAYEDIVKILKNQRLIILITEDNSGIILLRSAFTLGSEEILNKIKGETKND